MLDTENNYTCEKTHNLPNGNVEMLRRGLD